MKSISEFPLTPANKSRARYHVMQEGTENSLVNSPGPPTNVSPAKFLTGVLETDITLSLMSLNQEAEKAVAKMTVSIAKV